MHEFPVALMRQGSHEQTPAPMSEVVLRNVNKYYAQTYHAVKDVDLAIADQEFVALVGPSGCGKSTTLRMIAGLEDISSGEIRIGERVVNDLPPRDRDVAMVFQNYALYQHMNVYNNLAFGLRNKRVSEDRIKEAIDRAAGILGLNGLLARKPRELSGGQQQRVALGRCIVRNPKVFLFDEPLSNLDAKLRAQMRVEIKRLRVRVPTTSVFVTHDQVEAMTLGDRVVVMQDGSIQQVGTPLQVYGRPANRFVAGFIGAPAMNFLDVTISGEGSALFAETSFLRLAVPADMSQALAGWRGNRVILGVRPEHLALGRAAAQSSFDASVEVIEQLGSEMILETSAGDARLTVARVDPQVRLAAGEKVPLSVLPERLHFFDPVTEAAIR
jgi:multiple sugar transport system ATP-binding protein